MSTYLSYRRRYSEPEKPEPRFQWRMRVQSLMMSDNDNSPALSERRAQRYDSRREFRETIGFRPEASQGERPKDSSREAEGVEAYRLRRERFTRAKSDGQFRLRMKFSRHSDASESFDDGDSRADSEPENRKVRFSLKTENDLPADDKNDSWKQSPDQNSQTEAEDRQNGNENAEYAGAVGGEVSAGDNAETDTYVKDVSKGAIPKRYSFSRDSPMNEPKFAESNDSSFNATGDSLQHVGRAHDTEQDNKSQIDRHRDRDGTGLLAQPAINLEDQEVQNVAYKLTEEPGFSFKNISTKPRSASSEATRETMDDRHDNSRNVSPDNSDEIEDIEAIIERIIAEEEGRVDNESSAPNLNSSSERLTSGERDTVSSEMKKLRDDIDSCSEAEENGIEITRKVGQNKSRSTSLPSYPADKEEGVTSAVMPYSFSCPFSHFKKENTMEQNQKEEEDEEDVDDGWAYLPMILLEDVFTLLTPKERHQASQVCRQWYDLFYSPRVWETFILLERTLTKKRFNLYKGYQRELCPGKTQLCFRRVGSFFKRIVVTPITDYFNLYEFLRILAAFLQFQENHGIAAMPLLHTFDFTFACASRGDGELLIHGTGGQILEMIKQLLVRMSNLKHLKLNQLLIDVMEVPGLFDAVVNCFGESLNSLEMLNVTKVPLPLLELASFRNLIKLTISPQHLNEEVLLLVAGLNLMQLYLMQDPYTCECEPVCYEAWKLLREMAPWLQVYLEVSGPTRAELLIQPRAPVYGIFLRTPYSRLTNDLVMSIVEHYSKTLRYFVQERLPRIHGPRGFHSRCDSNALFLVRRCTTLHTLVIRERISTSTLILLASEGKHLTTLLVRKHALIKRCDWPRCGDWTKEFYSRLRQASLDYDKCTDEVCTLLRRRWRPLTDKQFFRLKIMPRLDMY